MPTLTETVKALLLENENAASLKPKSKAADAPKKIEGEVDDHGEPVVDVNSEKKYLAKAVSKSKEPGPKPPVGAEPMKKLSEEDESEEDESEEEEIDEATLGGAKYKDKENPNARHTEAEANWKLGIHRRMREAEWQKPGGSESESVRKAFQHDDATKAAKAVRIKAKAKAKVAEEEIEEDNVEETSKFEFDVSEDMAALFNGSDLSEEFKTNAETIFKAALNSKLTMYQDVLDEEYNEAITEAVAILSEGMEEKVEKYLNYVSEEWLSENEVAIETSLRTELTEDFIAGLRNLFMENYIDVPEDKVDVLENMSVKLEELETKLNEEISRNIELKEEINANKKTIIVNDIISALPATQAEKIKALAEETAFVNVKDFSEKVNLLKESYFPKNTVKKDTSLLAEVTENPNDATVQEEMTGPMANYARAISKTLPK